MTYETNTDPNPETQARRTVRARLGWMLHATVYLAVNAGLALLAMSHGRDPSIFPALPWGIGLAVHGLSVLVRPRIRSLHGRMVARERDRLARQHQA